MLCVFKTPGIKKFKDGYRIAAREGQPVYAPDIYEEELARLGGEVFDESPEPVEEPAVEPVIGFIEAFEQLVEKNDLSDFNQSGEPKVAAVREIVGADVSRADVQEAWAAFQEEAE